MQPSPWCFESKNSGAQGGKRVQGGSADGWSFGICDRNITSTLGTWNRVTLSWWPGKFSTTALCSPWLRTIPSSGFLLTIKLHNSCLYYWLRHLLETKIYSVFRRGLFCLKTYFLGRVHRGGKRCLKTPLWVLSWRYTGFFLADLKTAQRD